MKLNSKELYPSVTFRQFPIETLEMIFINIIEYLANCY